MVSWDAADLSCLSCRDVHWLQCPEHGLGDAPQRTGGWLRDRGGVHQHRQILFSRGERTSYTSRTSGTSTRSTNATFSVEDLTALAAIKEHLGCPGQRSQGCRNQFNEFVSLPRLELRTRSRSSNSRRCGRWVGASMFMVKWIFGTNLSLWPLR